LLFLLGLFALCLSEFFILVLLALFSLELLMLGDQILLLEQLEKGLQVLYHVDEDSLELGIAEEGPNITPFVVQCHLKLWIAEKHSMQKPNEGRPNT
jgi:hypothetical protein